MRYLFVILIAAMLCALPMAAVAVTASITLDVHQDIQDQFPNDFHVVGQVKSYISAPILSWHTDGPFTNFSYTITKVNLLDPTDPWYNFTADWSGSVGIPYCTVIHLGLLFDVEGANTVINLEGWWTLNGQPIGDIIHGQYNNGFVPVAGFDVSQSPNGEGDKIRITNGKQSDPPLPPPPGPNPPLFETEIVQMDVIGFLPGQAPPPEALSEYGQQNDWPWVHVNNANGLPISTTNPIYVMPDSFFDVFLEAVVPGHPGLPLGQQIYLQPGGTLVARTLTQFTNNAGQTEQRWQWDVHQAPNTVDWRPGDEYKWVQMPDVTNTGIDIRCDMNDGIPRVLADDFKCIETGPITDVHFWGSWLNDIKGNIEKIHLSLHQDVPAGRRAHSAIRLIPPFGRRTSSSVSSPKSSTRRFPRHSRSGGGILTRTPYSPTAILRCGNTTYPSTRGLSFSRERRRIPSSTGWMCRSTLHHKEPRRRSSGGRLATGEPRTLAAATSWMMRSGVSWGFPTGKNSAIPLRIPRLRIH